VFSFVYVDGEQPFQAEGHVTETETETEKWRPKIAGSG
jgi:hypothetical protein